MENCDEPEGGLAISGLLRENSLANSAGEAEEYSSALGDSFAALSEWGQVTIGGRRIYNSVYDVPATPGANYGAIYLRITGTQGIRHGDDSDDAEPFEYGDTGKSCCLGRVDDFYLG